MQDNQENEKIIKASPSDNKDTAEIKEDLPPKKKTTRKSPSAAKRTTVSKSKKDAPQGEEKPTVIEDTEEKSEESTTEVDTLNSPQEPIAPQPDAPEDNESLHAAENTVFVIDTETEPPMSSEGSSKYENIEHFSDYKSQNDITEAQSLDDNKEKAEENYSFFENLTILGEDTKNEASEQEALPRPQKYENPDRERYDPTKPRKVDARFDFVELFIFTLVAVMLLTTFVFRHSVVKGGSMENTLYEGEHLIISNLFYTPKRNDIVVCQDHETGLRDPFVKRIIAIEGDTVEIWPDGSVFVNDKRLPESYVYLDGPDDFPGLKKTTVPEGHIFVMGDHRNDSTDSRKQEFGFVREDAILGKVLIRFYPFDRFGTVK